MAVPGGEALTLPTGPTGVEATVLGPVAVVLVVGAEVFTDSALFPVSLDPQPASARSVAMLAVTTEGEDHRKERLERSSVVISFTRVRGVETHTMAQTRIAVFRISGNSLPNPDVPRSIFHVAGSLTMGCTA
jgi:hypothetical protein